MSATETSLETTSELDVFTIWKKHQAAYAEYEDFLAYSSDQAAEEKNTPSDLVLGERLGEGEYAEVFKGTWKGETVAIKKFKGGSDQKKVREEAEIMTKVSTQSKYLVCLQTSYLNEPPYYLVMDYMPQGDLYHLLSSSQEIPWVMRYRIALNVSEGLNLLHQADVPHNDIASTNIFLDKDDTAKLGDFGLSAISKDKLSLDCLGAAKWLSPEVAGTGKASKASDVYSLGMVLWELTSRKEPFRELSPTEAMRQIAQKRKEIISVETPAEFKALIEACWQEPDSRPTAHKIVECLTGLLQAEEEKQRAETEAKKMQTSVQAIMSGAVSGTVLFSKQEEKPITKPSHKRKQGRAESLRESGTPVKKVFNKEDHIQSGSLSIFGSPT